MLPELFYGVTSHYLLSFQKRPNIFRTSWILKLMVQFNYLDYSLGIEIVSFHLMQQMESQEGNGLKLEKVGLSFFQFLIL